MTRSKRLLRIAGSALAVALLLFVWSQHVSPRAGAVYDDTDGDGFLDLLEQIAGSDPAGRTSVPEDIGADLIFGYTFCTNGIDDDRDGVTDLADPGCADTDHDFFSDPSETLLGSDPSAVTSTPESSMLDAVYSYFGVGIGVTCGDGTDNDRDGATDAADTGCPQIQDDGDDFTDFTEKVFGSDPADPSSVPEHEIPNPGSCADGLDNDLDGQTDGADAGCRPAANDDFADATVIGSLPFDETEKISTATRQPGDPSLSCYESPQMNVWYSHTAGSDDVLVADTAGSNLETVLSVWTLSGGRLREVGCASAYTFGSGARIAFRPVAGQTYYFQAGGFIPAGAPGNLRFQLHAGTPPGNDDFANPTVVSSLPFSSTLEVRDATTEFHEPSCSYSRPISTVWYSFSPAQDTLVLVDASDSTNGSLIGVWVPTQFGPAQVACSYDNFSGQILQGVVFAAEAGETYYVQVGGLFYGPSPEDLQLSIEVAIPPANDDFADATAVTSFPFTDTVDAMTATVELSEPRPSCTYGATLRQTLWYRYTPTGDGFIEAGTDNTFRYNIIVAAYRGDSLDALTEVACSQPYPPGNRAAFRALAGETYYIQVGSQTYNNSEFINASGSPFPTPEEPPPPTMVTFFMDTLSVPDCAPQTFSHTDPIGDSGNIFGPPLPGAQAPDFSSISGGNDGRYLCLDIQFATPLPPREAGSNGTSLNLNFDVVEPFSQRLSCFNQNGADLYVYLSLPGNLVFQMYPYFPGPQPPEGGYIGYSIFDGSSVRVLIPTGALGGDDGFRFTAQANNRYGSDCAPDAGTILSPFPAIPGDANCDGFTNSMDSLIILQMFARLIGSVPCQISSDVNDNGGVGPIDATLILQYDSGMLATLPMPPPVP
jgi:hypothetical protein